MSGRLTFLLQSQLPLGLDVLQRCSQVPGQAARAADRQQGALRGETTRRSVLTTDGCGRGRKSPPRTLELRPSVAAPCCRGDAEPDLD